MLKKLTEEKENRTWRIDRRMRNEEELEEIAGTGNGAGADTLGIA